MDKYQNSIFVMLSSSAAELGNWFLNIFSSKEFVSTLLGALIAGGFSFLALRRTVAESRKARAEDYDRVNRAIAYSLLFKVSKIHSDIVSIQKEFHDCQRKAESEASDIKIAAEQIWRHFQPFANMPLHEQFTSAELALFLSLKNDELFNLILSLDARHRSLIEAIATLNSEHRKLTGGLKPLEVRGSTVTFGVDVQNLAFHQAQMVLVNNLIVEVAKLSSMYLVEYKDFPVRVGKVLREQLNLKVNVSLCE